MTTNAGKPLLSGSQTDGNAFTVIDAVTKALKTMANTMPPKISSGPPWPTAATTLSCCSPTTTRSGNSPPEAD